MGRGRKKKYVKKLTSKDQDMLRAFRNCGLLSSKHLKENLAMSEKRVLNFKRDGYIEQVRLLNPKTKKMEAVFQLLDKGRNLIESKMSLQHFYRSVSGRHDLQVADEYLSLHKDEQLSWMTESELKRVSQLRTDESQGLQSIRLQEDYRDIKVSPTDGAYKSREGHIVAVEVVTRNYSSMDIKAKEDFAEAMDMHLKIIKI